MLHSTWYIINYVLISIDDIIIPIPHGWGECTKDMNDSKNATIHSLFSPAEAWMNSRPAAEITVTPTPPTLPFPRCAPRLSNKARDYLLPRLHSRSPGWQDDFRSILIFHPTFIFNSPSYPVLLLFPLSFLLPLPLFPCLPTTVRPSSLSNLSPSLPPFPCTEEALAIPEILTTTDLSQSPLRPLPSPYLHATSRHKEIFTKKV